MSQESFGGVVTTLGTALTSPAKIAFVAYVVLVYVNRISTSTGQFLLIVLAVLFFQVFHDDYLRIVLNKAANDPPAKRLPLVGACGLTVFLAVIGGLMMLERPIAWQNTSIRASLIDLSNERSLDGETENVIFRLALANQSKQDYRVDPSTRFAVMFQTAERLYPARGAVMESPLWVLSGQTTVIS